MVEIEKLWKEIQEGKCPYLNPACEDCQGCFSPCCNSGLDENGRCYCERIHDKIMKVNSAEDELKNREVK